MKVVSFLPHFAREWGKKNRNMSVVDAQYYRVTVYVSEIKLIPELSISLYINRSILDTFSPTICVTSYMLTPCTAVAHPIKKWGVHAAHAGWQSSWFSPTIIELTSGLTLLTVTFTNRLSIPHQQNLISWPKKSIYISEDITSEIHCKGRGRGDEMNDKPAAAPLQRIWLIFPFRRVRTATVTFPLKWGRTRTPRRTGFFAEGGKLSDSRLFWDKSS